MRVGTYSIHTALPLFISAKLGEGIEVYDTKLSSGVWPSWRWMSSTGLLLRLNCQWHTDPKRWFNSALVSNPFPVTHSFVLKPKQLGQPAGGKTYRCCWLEVGVGVGVGYEALICAVIPEWLSGLQSVGVPLFADKMWVGILALLWTISHPSTHVSSSRVL